MSNPFEILAWVAAALIVWGGAFYELGRRHERQDMRLRMAKPARRVASRVLPWRAAK